jgi:TetR/AcrR family transcriptional regulator, regulator of cefoperazone and chloramphenicol sensitivity
LPQEETMQIASVPRRRPAQGGYARGEETRARIISTALRIFGEIGYDQASTRQIAAEAGVNPPALQYYFHSKEGLHRACAQHIIDRVGVVISPVVAQASAAARSDSREEASAALFSLLDALVDGFATVGSENWSRFIARGRVDGAGPAIALLREHLGAPLVDAVTELLSVIDGSSARGEMVRLRSLAILGQINWLLANRDNTLAMMRWAEFDQRNLALIKVMVREHTQAILRAFVTASAAQPRSKARKRP